MLANRKYLKSEFCYFSSSKSLPERIFFIDSKSYKSKCIFSSFPNAKQIMVKITLKNIILTKNWLFNIYIFVYRKKKTVHKVPRYMVKNLCCCNFNKINISFLILTFPYFASFGLVLQLSSTVNRCFFLCCYSCLQR